MEWIGAGIAVAGIAFALAYYYASRYRSRALYLRPEMAAPDAEAIKRQVLDTFRREARAMFNTPGDWRASSR